jgi:toxin YoeB
VQVGGDGSPARSKPMLLNIAKLWLSRATDKDRLVYDIQPDMIIIIACRFHYDDH